MALKINPPGTPLPPNHPFATARIIFGQKRPDSSTPKPAAPASPPQAGQVDIADEAWKELGPKQP